MKTSVEIVSQLSLAIDGHESSCVCERCKNGKETFMLASDVYDIRTEIILRHNRVTKMIASYLVACKGQVADSWMEGFIECGAITYDSHYPTGFIAPVLL